MTGGSVQVTAGAGTSSNGGAGGAIIYTGGEGAGGNVELKGGKSSTGRGGSVYLTGGEGAVGGLVMIETEQSGESGETSGIFLATGITTVGTSGQLSMKTGTASGGAGGAITVAVG